MDDTSILFDETESTQTRYVGFLTSSNRFDVAITKTHHFYGKSLVIIIQTGRSAIIGEEEAQSPDFLMAAFALENMEQAEEISNFLSGSL